MPGTAKDHLSDRNAIIIPNILTTFLFKYFQLRPPPLPEAKINFFVVDDLISEITRYIFAEFLPKKRKRT
jgi:hypothetical protein